MRTEVRDRLAALAAERRTTVGELLAEFVGVPSSREQPMSRAETIAYIRQHFCPDFSEADVEAARRALGRIPETRVLNRV